MLYLLFFLGLFGSMATDPRIIEEIEEELPLLSEDSVTRRPTNNPTRRPTRNPTAAPTRRPTKAPTVRPTRKPTMAPTRRPTRNPTVAPTRRPTNSPTPRPTRKPTESPTNRPTRPTQSPTKAPTNLTRAPTATPTNQPTFPTQIPTNPPTTPMICEVGANHSFVNPNATHCRSLIVNSTCQLPPSGSWHCLTFDDFGIFTGPDGTLVGQYSGYSFQSIDPNFSADFVLVDNNTFTGPINYSSTWPNYIAYSRNIPLTGSFYFRMYRSTIFDVLSLTVASSESTPSTLNFYALDNSSHLVYNYSVANITRQNSFVVLNWTRIFFFQVFGDSPFVYGLDSIVATL